MAQPTTQTINLDALSADRKAALTDELYEVQCEVFDGVERKEFAKYVIDSSSQWNWIDVYRSGAEAVGYFAMHRFDEKVGGRKAAIFRAEAGVRRAFRGRVPMGRLFMRRVLPWIATHPTRLHYYLGSLVHPSSYHALARYAQQIWPNGAEETPPELVQLLCSLGDRFGLAEVDPNNPLLRDVGWCTRDTDVEKLYWRECSKPAVRYFVETNPGYGEGHGMLTLVPLSLGNLVPGVASLLRGRARRKATRIRAALQGLPALRPRVKPEAIEHKLSALDALKKLDTAGRARLILACRTSLAAPGQYIIREGSRGDRMFMILNGAVYVVKGSGQEEQVLDELHEGEVFGEMALMTGAPRTASVRAATSVLLLEIERSAVMELAGADANVKHALEMAHDGRAFDTLINSLPRFDVVHEDRWHWFESGTVHDVAPGEPLAVNGDTCAFVAIGRVEARIDDRWVEMSAPALVGGEGPLELRATSTPCRVTLLPAEPPGPIDVEGATALALQDGTTATG